MIKLHKKLLIAVVTCCSIAVPAGAQGVVTGIALDALAETQVPLELAKCPVAAAAKPSFDMGTFRQLVKANWARTMNFTSQMANAEATLQSVIGTESLLGKVYKTSRWVGKNVEVAQSVGDLIDVGQSTYDAALSAYNSIGRLVSSGKISAQEAEMMVSCINAALVRSGNLVDYIKTLVTSDAVSPTEFLKECEKAAKRMLNNLLLIDKPLKDKEKELKAKEDAAKVDSTFKVMFGDGKAAGEPIVKPFTQEDAKKVIEEARSKPQADIEKLAIQMKTKANWEGVCDFIFIAWGLIMMFLLAWNYMKQQHGNAQNQDAMKKLIYVAIFGALLIILFKNVLLQIIFK